MVHINDPLLIIGNSSPYSGGSGFPFLVILSGPLPYNRKSNQRKCLGFLLLFFYVIFFYCCKDLRLVVLLWVFFGCY